MRATDAEKALAADIWAHFHAQKYDKARGLLDQALRSSHHHRFRRIEARFLLFEGCEHEAADVLKDILPDVWHPGSWELAIAGVNACRAREIADHKILFFPIPKCGSTSVMNVLKLITGEDVRGEDIHQEDNIKRPVELVSLKADYPDHFTCALVREPMKRLWSFFHGNIEARDQLAKHHDGLDEFYGLPTRPDWGFFLKNLGRYRQVFITARNHTEPVSAFIGGDPKIFSWIGGLADLPDLVQLLSARTGRDLPVLAEMKSPDGKDQDLPTMPEALAELYAGDYRAYGNYF